MRPCTRRIVPAEGIIKATSLNDALGEHAPLVHDRPKRTPDPHQASSNRPPGALSSELLRGVGGAGLRPRRLSVSRGGTPQAETVIPPDAALVRRGLRFRRASDGATL